MKHNRTNIAIDEKQYQRLKSLKINNIKTTLREKTNIALDLLFEKYESKKKK